MQKLIFSLLLLTLTAAGITSDWYTYESEKNYFKIDFPNEPLKESKTSDSKLGPIEFDVIKYPGTRPKKQKDLIYIVDVVTYSDSLMSLVKPSDKASFAQFVLKSKGLPGKVLSATKVYQGDYEGTELLIEFPNKTDISRLRIFIENKKAYTLQAVGNKKYDQNKAMSRFFDSFELHQINE